MRRRDFIAGLGATAGWPTIARAQRGERVRRVGVLWPGAAANDPAVQSFMAAFRDGMARLGWVEERNLRIDVRFPRSDADADRLRAYAAELVSVNPDAIVTLGAATTRAVQEQTQTIPIVIAVAGDVYANGIVKNLAHPEGNTTGVTNLFASMGSKWLELLKEAVPRLERVGIITRSQNRQGSTRSQNPQGSTVASIEEAARVLAVRSVRLSYSDSLDIVRAIDAFATEPNGGLILPPPPPNAADSQTILRLATQYRLPTMSFDRLFPQGALMSYGSNEVDLFRRVPFYVDRILRGAKPGDLPVEFPTKFELVVNLKTAKAIGLTISESFLVRADQVIE